MAARQGGDSKCVLLVFARGDTTALSGLCAKLYHAFLVLSIEMLKFNFVCFKNK